MLLRRIIAVSAGLMACATMASAQSLAISGEWFDNRGPDIDIPTNGGATSCAPGGSPSCPNAIVVGVNAPVKPRNGGVPATPLRAGNVVPAAAGVVGAPLTVPPNIFGQNLPPAVVAVPTSPQVRQLNTTFLYTGPVQTLTQLTLVLPNGCQNVTPATTCFNAGVMDRAGVLAATRQLAAGAPAVQKARGNRPAVQATGLLTGMGSNPGPAPWTTATTTSLGATLNSASVRYIPGPNGFGGTMNSFLDGNGSLVITGVALGPVLAGNQPLANSVTTTVTTTTFLGATNMVVNPAGGANNPAGGGTWGFERPGGQPSGLLYQSFMTATPCPTMPPFLPIGCDLVTALGPVLTTGGTAMNPVPLAAATSTQSGFPWTTGMVRVSRTGTQGGQPLTSTISGTGADFINGDGNREIHLVAGSLSIRSSVAGTTGLGQLSGIEMVLPEPSENAMLAAALGVIGLCSLVRRRF